MIIVARTWVQMTVRDTHVTTYFCSNPVSDILVIHRVTIRIIFSWSRNVQVFRFNYRLYTKSKLRDFPQLFIRLSWITEIKIAQQLISIRSWCMSVRGILFPSF